VRGLFLRQHRQEALDSVLVLRLSALASVMILFLVVGGSGVRMRAAELVRPAFAAGVAKF
jgi:hypothetical protein